MILSQRGSGSGHWPIPLWLLNQKLGILVYILYLPYKLHGHRAGWVYYLTVSSNSAYSVKAIDAWNKKKKKKNKMEKWLILQSIKNHEAYAINLSNTSKQHKKMLQKVILSKFKRIRQILKHIYFVCALFEILTKVLVSPYYKPLSWFIIQLTMMDYYILGICQKLSDSFDDDKIWLRLATYCNNYSHMHGILAMNKHSI